MTDPVNTEPTVEETEVVVDPPVAALEPEPAEGAPVVSEDISDATLRAWARDNGIEDVPASGKLSATWREQITNAMANALALDPKEEVSAEVTLTEPAPSLETVTTEETTTETVSTPDGESTSPSTEESKPEGSFVKGDSAFDSPNTFSTSQTVDVSEEKPKDAVEYHSVFEAPNTFVTSQAFTA